jgi:hypothetical protein
MRIDLWVQWWATAIKNDDARSTSYWLGMFALLSVLPLILLSLSILYVHNPLSTTLQLFRLKL